MKRECDEKETENFSQFSFPVSFLSTHDDDILKFKELDIFFLCKSKNLKKSIFFEIIFDKGH
ncbi:MAG: hypothetical protein LBD88_00235 [Candidatus Peribacteria bacterium]|jgi:hypothetical protein|nr:hypothetical protein [Candidatus Peribacteria bacterium]